MKLTQMRQRLRELVARMDELRAIDAPTSADQETLDGVITEATELRGQIQTLETREANVAELRTFAEAEPYQMGGAPALRSIQGQPIQLNVQRQESSDSNRLILNTEFGGRFAADCRAHGLNDKLIEFTASKEYRGEFMAAIRSGQLTRALNETTIVGGGAFVPPDIVQGIIQRRLAFKRLSTLVNVVQTSRNSVVLMKHTGGDSNTTNNLAFQTTGHEGATTEDTGLQANANVTVYVHRRSLYAVADRDFLEDTAVDVETWFSENVNDAYTAAVEYDIAQGTGVNTAFGIATRAGDGTLGTYERVNVGNTATAAGLMTLIGTLDEQYGENASFAMRRLVYYTQLMSLFGTGSSGPVFGTQEVTVGGTEKRIENMLLGYPVALAGRVAAAGSGNDIMYYGDFKAAYSLVERIALQVEPLLDSTVQKADQRGWYVRARWGGDRTAEWALKIGKQT